MKVGPASNALRRLRTVERLALLALVVGLTASPVRARPNTHAPAISTWDTRAANLVLAYRGGLIGDPSMSALGLSTNFVSQNAAFSAQFGLNYVRYRREPSEAVTQGGSLGAVGLFNIPLAERHPNGVPRTSLGLYLGAVPTVLSSGRVNYVSVPFVLGLGVPWSPSPRLTLSPWLEVSPGLSFDPRVNPVVTQDAIDAAIDGTLTEDEVEDIVREGLDAELRSSTGLRAGLAAAFHVSERVSLNADLMLTGRIMSLGGGLVLRWDAFVPGARARGSLEDCRSAIADAKSTCAAFRRRPQKAPPPADGQRRRARRAGPRAEHPAPRDPRSTVTRPNGGARRSPSAAPALRKRTRTPAAQRRTSPLVPASPVSD